MSLHSIIRNSVDICHLEYVLTCTICMAALDCMSTCSSSCTRLHCVQCGMSVSMSSLVTVGDSGDEISFSLNKDRRTPLLSFWRRISAQFDPLAVVVSVFLFFIVLFVFAVVETWVYNASSIYSSLPVLCYVHTYIRTYIWEHSLLHVTTCQSSNANTCSLLTSFTAYNDCCDYRPAAVITVSGT